MDRILAKMSNGQIVDVSPVKVKDLGIVDSDSKMLSFNGSEEITNVRASSWRYSDKKNNSIESRLNNTGWFDCK